MNIRYLVYVVFILSILISPASHASPALLVFGDSLSAAYGIPVNQSWVHLLGERISKQGYPFKVFNASISGETTSGGLSRIDAAVSKYLPRVVLIELGANDGLRGLPVKDMQNNLQEMIQVCKKHHAKILLLGMMIPPNYGLRYTEEFKNSYLELAKKNKIAVVPFLLEGVAGKSDMTQDDGLHPTAEAQDQIMETVWKELKPILDKTN